MDDEAKVVPLKPDSKQPTERSFKAMNEWARNAVLQDVTLVDDPSDAEKPGASGRVLVDAAPALVRAAFEASIPPAVRRQMLQGDALAVIVTVPSAAWVQPMARYLDEIMVARRYARSGSERKDQPTEGNEAVASSLADGEIVLGISQDPSRFLPSLLLASADMHVTVKRPDTAVIARAMRLCLRGRVPPDLPAGLGAGMDFAEIIAALRRNTKPTDAIRRLQAFNSVSVGGDDDGEILPTLEEAIFYGEARDWALGVAKDFAEAKLSGNYESIPRGAIFTGAPGTGKSVLAKLISRQCNIPILYCSIGDLFAKSDGYLGGVIKATRAVFERAAALNPSCIFLDECDALPNRATMDNRAKEWWNTFLLDIMQMISTAPKGCLILSATNVDPVQHLDAALLRPGRLERIFEIKSPSTAEALESVFRFHLRGALANEDLLPLASIALGATPAVVMDYVRSARRAAKEAGRSMALQDLAHVICPPDTRTAEERRRTAIHEAAHIVIAIEVGITTVRSVSIMPKGDTTGRVTVDGLGDLFIEGREQIDAIVTMLLAGRSGEIVIFGEPTGGAGGDPNSDLAHATRLVASMYGSLGLAGGGATYRGAMHEMNHVMTLDPDLRKQVDVHLRTLAAKAELLVRQHRSDISTVAELLLERRFLTADEVRAVLAGTPRRIAIKSQ